MTEKERNLLYGVVSLILPENILDQFDIVKLEDEDIARNDSTYQPFKHNVHIYLDEQDNRTAEQRATLKPNGFTEYTSVKDYPVRNRLLTLHIRRRRYLDAEERCAKNRRTYRVRHPKRYKGRKRDARPGGARKTSSPVR